jgi:hypothetical protein
VDGRRPPARTARSAIGRRQRGSRRSHAHAAKGRQDGVPQHRTCSNPQTGSAGRVMGIRTCPACSKSKNCARAGSLGAGTGQRRVGPAPRKAAVGGRARRPGAVGGASSGEHVIKTPLVRSCPCLSSNTGGWVTVVDGRRPPARTARSATGRRQRWSRRSHAHAAKGRQDGVPQDRTCSNPQTGSGGRVMGIRTRPACSKSKNCARAGSLGAGTGQRPGRPRAAEGRNVPNATRPARTRRPPRPAPPPRPRPRW